MLQNGVASMVPYQPVLNPPMLQNGVTSAVPYQSVLQPPTLQNSSASASYTDHLSLAFTDNQSESQCYIDHRSESQHPSIRSIVTPSHASSRNGSHVTLRVADSVVGSVSSSAGQNPIIFGVNASDDATLWSATSGALEATS